MRGEAFSWDGEGLARKILLLAMEAENNRCYSQEILPEGDESDGPEIGAGVRGG